MSVEQCLQAYENKLKKSAQLLGVYNLELNASLCRNEQIRKQIGELNDKIPKKQAQIEQEDKDKMIIHQQLNSAEKNKHRLELKIHNNNTLVTNNNKTSTHETTPKIQNVPNLPAKSQSTQEPQGTYEPPPLFGESNSSQGSNEDNHEQMLAKLKQKLGSNKDMDDDDDQ